MLDADEAKISDEIKVLDKTYVEGRIAMKAVEFKEHTCMVFYNLVFLFSDLNGIESDLEGLKHSLGLAASQVALCQSFDTTRMKKKKNWFTDCYIYGMISFWCTI